MKRSFVCIGIVLFVVSTPRADPAPMLKPVKETWDAVYIEGAKAGYFHSTILEIERDGKKFLACTQAMHIGVKREGQVVTLRIENGTEEAPDGKVVGVSMTQFAGAGKLTQTGRVEGSNLMLRTSASDEVRKMPWNDEVIGLVRQERLFAEKKVKPGDQFSYLSYEPTLQTFTEVQVTVKDAEEVDMLEVNKDAPKAKAVRVKKKLLRVEVVPAKVKINGRPLQLPGMTGWLDDDLQMVRSEINQPGLGLFTVFRTTRAVAEEEGAAPALLPDLLITNLIPLNRPIPHPATAKEVVYHVSLKGDDDPTDAFTQDSRQKALNVEGGTFDLRVRAVREPLDTKDADGPGDESLKSTYFLDSGNEKVKALAKEIVGDETDPWRKAQRIEKWVHEHMKVSTAVDYIPASHTVADLRGDCRQYAMLTAALCRAAKLPARTALGLVYDKDPVKGPVLAFHMWTEVWVEGQWMDVDAVWGEGGVGADHLKITDHSWSDTETLAPLGAVTRVMGKIKVEVKEVK